MNTNTKHDVIAVNDLRTLKLAEVGKGQRDFRPNHRIFKSDFNRDMVRVTVSVRDSGDMIVVDGQHGREFALRSKDYGPYLVNAYYGLAPQEEAELFVALNTSEIVQPVHMFNNRVAAGDPSAIAADAILKATGWRMAAGKGSKGTIAAVKVVEHWAEYDPASLTKALTVIHKAWDGASEGAYFQIVNALASIFSRHSDADAGHFVTALSKVKPNSIRAEATSLAGTGLRSVSRAEATDEVLVSLYNKGKRKGTLIRAS